MGCFFPQILKSEGPSCVQKLHSLSKSHFVKCAFSDVNINSGTKILSYLRGINYTLLSEVWKEYPFHLHSFIVASRVPGILPTQHYVNIIHHHRHIHCTRVFSSGHKKEQIITWSQNLVWDTRTNAHSSDATSCFIYSYQYHQITSLNYRNFKSGQGHSHEHDLQEADWTALILMLVYTNETKRTM
jgi:hypothetical protein